MRSEQGDSRYDAAIDAAARSLTAADPSPALRARVRERIGRRSLVASAGWWLVPVGMTAAVAIVALFLWRSPEPSSTRAALQPVPTPRAGTAPGVNVPETVPDTMPEARQATAATRPSVRRVLPSFEPAPEDLEPLIPPLAIPLLETKQIAVDVRSGVMPIEIEPLRIEPLQGE
ncbi:MAG TPA: hypothetical protein VM846_05655 [Vicinamibacterales bacterium]|nr:hypothetical protein [Vicinamibacterales bacterium]